MAVVLLLIGLLGFTAPATARGEEFQSSPLTLTEAMSRALVHHPALAAGSAEVRAREAEAVEAGLRPNPVLSLEAENLAGTGEFSGAGAAETTLSISQAFELGDKRQLRRALAEAETAAAQREYELARSEVTTRTRESFYAVLVAQERLALAEELAEVAAGILITVEERIAAGKAAETERIRARIALADLRVAQHQARSAMEAGRHELAARMGLERPDFGQVQGELTHLPALPPFEQLETLVVDSPALTRRLAEVAARRQGVSLERARRLPDIELGLGARYLGESDDSALVLGISVPLPVFDRNQGGIAAAESRLSRARQEQRAALLQARGALAGAWQAVSAARRETEVLRDEILPAATRSMEAVEYGYRAGKFGILDVLDAQRTLIDARGRYLEALAEVHRSVAGIERLLGCDLSESTNSTTVESPGSDFQ